MIYYSQKGRVQSHVTYLNLGKCDNISETVEDRDIVAMEDYSRKSYVAYQMAPLPIGNGAIWRSHLLFETFISPIARETVRIY